MLVAFRFLLRASPHQVHFRPASPPCPAAVYAVRLQQTTSSSSKAKPDHQEREDNMAQENPKPKKTTSVDPMSNSYGEGYAIRSDEEGFGGIYGGNQSLHLEECNKGDVAHEKNHSDDYDKMQGSEVKEKEKGRNLPNGYHVG